LHDDKLRLCTGFVRGLFGYMTELLQSCPFNTPGKSA